MATSQLDVIQKFMKSLDDTKLSGTAVLDEAVRACSNFDGIQDAIDHMIEDCKNSSSGTYFLKKYCGIKLYNEDTGAITGSDAGGSVTKTAKSIVPENGEASYPSGTSFTKRGLTVVVLQSSLTEDEQLIVQGLYNWWIEEALKLIEESYCSNYTFSNHKLYVYFYNNSSDGAVARASSNSLSFNMAYCSRGLTNDTINGGFSYFYLDRVVAHELTHSITATNINSFWSLPKFFTEGIAELTHGIDDERTYSIRELSMDSSKLAKYTDINYEGTVEEEHYAGGFIFLRYLAKQGSGVVDSAEEQAKYSTIEIAPNIGRAEIIDSNIKILGSKSDDYIESGGSNVTINAGDGNDIIYNSFHASLTAINAGTGKDYIYNYVSQVTINGEDGDDFIHNSGNWVTINGGNGNDTIDNSGSNVTISGGNGNDSIYNRGYRSTNASLVLINAGAGDDTITNYGSKVTIIAGEGNDYIDNVYGASQSVIEAGDGDDTISNISSQVTINAGVGNDIISLYGGYGYNLIQYAAGDDVDTIYGYNSKDTIQISGSEYTTSESGNDVIISVGEGSMTFVNAKGQTLNIVTIEGGFDIPSDGEDDTQSGGEDTESGGDQTLYGREDTPTGSILDPAPDSTTRDSLTYNESKNKKKNHTEVTLGSSWAGTLSSSDYESTSKKIDASKSNSSLYIAGNEKANIISGGGGNNTINAGAGKDTLTGGSGKDVFMYSNGDGKDIITDYSPAEDVIRLASGTIKKVAVSKKNVVFTVGKGTITLKDAKNKKITVTDASGNTSSQLYGSKTLNIADGDGKTLDSSLNTMAVTLDASNRTTNLNLIANSKANVINLGKSYSTVTGGKGKDTIIFSGGTTEITDYTSGQDKVKLASKLNKAEVSGSNVKFTTDDGILTLDNASGKKITVINSDNSTTTMIVGNGSNTISGTKKADTLNALDGDNVLDGGAGNDLLIGGANSDTFNAGKGNDNIQLAAAHNKATIIYSGGNDKVTNFNLADIVTLAKGVTATAKKNSPTEYTLTLKKGKTKLGTLNISGTSEFETSTSTSTSTNTKKKFATTVTNYSVKIGGIEAIYETHKETASTIVKAAYQEHWFMDNSEFEMQNAPLNSILDSNYNLIDNDYNFDNTSIERIYIASSKISLSSTSMDSKT